MRLDATSTGRGIALVAAIGWLTALGCKHAPEPPPSFNVFGITDKFFDVKSVGGKSFVALGYGSKILRSDDAGATWQKAATPLKRSLTRLTFVENGKGWGVGHEGKVFGTTDGGKTWTEQKSNVNLSLFDVDFVNENRGFAVGDLSTLIATADGGKSWFAGKVEMSQIGVREDMSLAITDPIFYSVDMLDENTVWVGGEFGQIRFTDDGGATWAAQHASLLSAKYRDIMTLPTILCLRAKDRQTALAVGTYGAIIYTVDGGNSWQFGQSPVAIPLYDIRWLPDGDALIVGSSGVVLRGNPEKGFQPATMPPGVFTWISSVDVAPTGNAVAVGGHGLILASSDFGKDWQVTAFQ
jgi:photosystem II stability/assembly factor-like uncharacterized protein